MGEEYVLAKAAFATRHLGFDRNARQVPKAHQRRSIECKRHERRARRDDRQPELLGDTIAERGRADLGNGQATRRDHHGRRDDRTPRRCNSECAVHMIDGIDRAGHPPLHLPALAFGPEHRDDVHRRFVAEKLS